MKKLTGMLCAFIALVVMAPAQKLDVKFEHYSQLQPEALYTWQDTGMRAGLATPVLGVKVDGKLITDVCVWTLSDVRNTDVQYVGFGVSVPVYKTDRLKFSLAAGWSTSLSRNTLGNPLGVRRADGYGVGVQILYKF